MRRDLDRVRADRRGHAVVHIPVFTSVGTKVKTTFTTLQTALK
jgi:hypothetical protein